MSLWSHNNVISWEKEEDHPAAQCQLHFHGPFKNAAAPKHGEINAFRGRHEVMDGEADFLGHIYETKYNLLVQK